MASAAPSSSPSSSPSAITAAAKSEIVSYADHFRARAVSMAFEPQVGSPAQISDISDWFCLTSECVEVPIGVNPGTQSLQYPPSSINAFFTTNAHTLLSQRHRAGASVLLPRGGIPSPAHDIVVGRRGSVETLRGVAIRLARPPNPKLGRLGIFCTWRRPTRCTSLPTKAPRLSQSNDGVVAAVAAGHGALFDFGFVFEPEAEAETEAEHEVEPEPEVEQDSGASECACSFAVQIGDEWYFVGVFGPDATLVKDRIHLVASDLFRIYASVYETPAVAMEAFTRPSLNDALPALSRMAQAQAVPK